MFLAISQNSQGSTCARVSFLIKLQTSGLQLYQKETLAQVFSWEFCKISKNTLLQNTSGRLLLSNWSCSTDSPWSCVNYRLWYFLVTSSSDVKRLLTSQEWKSFLLWPSTIKANLAQVGKSVPYFTTSLLCYIFETCHYLTQIVKNIILRILTVTNMATLFTFSVLTLGTIFNKLWIQKVKVCRISAKLSHINSAIARRRKEGKRKVKKI